MSTKACTKCFEALTFDHFYTDKSKKDGLSSSCKSCHSGKTYTLIKDNHKICTKCKEIKHIDEFSKCKLGKKGRRGTCLECYRALRRDYKLSPERQLYYPARRRAKKLGREFNIELCDIIIPEFCPLLNIPLKSGVKTIVPGSPTLDRIDNTKGYIKGNVWVICHRANTLKKDLSLEEMELIVNNLRKIYEKQY